MGYLAGWALVIQASCHVAHLSHLPDLLCVFRILVTKLVTENSLSLREHIVAHFLRSPRFLGGVELILLLWINIVHA